MAEPELRAHFEPSPPGSTGLMADELHVWAVPLVGDGDAPAHLLSPIELQRAERFRFVDHRRRYAISHGALRTILGGYADADPAELEFIGGPRGKPYLKRPADLFFSLSHSGQLAMVAVCRTELGADLEKMRHLESLMDIARRHFSVAEFAAMEEAGEGARLCAFYRCWTRKEAYIKATGQGLAVSLDGFDVSLDDAPRFLAFREGGCRPEDWHLLDVSPSEEYAAAVALRGGEHRVRAFRFAAG